MFSTSKQPVDPAHFQYFAESLADLLSAGGDGQGANQVLSVVSKQVNTPSIALRRAEFHLQRQDPASALSALIPAWEAGYNDDELELLLGLCSLSVGLEDVVDGLTDREELSEGLTILRWILACCDETIEQDINLGCPKIQWSLIRCARILSEQGRPDLVGAIVQRLERLGTEQVIQRLSAIKRSEWMPSEPIRPGIDDRDSISEGASLQAMRAVYNWVWSAARQVFRGERVLILGQDCTRFVPLFKGATVEAIDTRNALSSEHALDSTAAAQYDHVVLVYGYETSCSARDLTLQLWKTLKHGGQLHFVSSLARQAHHFDAFIAPHKLLGLFESVGFELLGQDCRCEEGIPADLDGEASVLVGRLQKNLV